jgi:hypothetical protein
MEEHGSSAPERAEPPLIEHYQAPWGSLRGGPITGNEGGPMLANEIAQIRPRMPPGQREDGPYFSALLEEPAAVWNAP